MPSLHEQVVNASGTPLQEYEHGVTVTFSSGVCVTEPFTARRSDRMHKAIGREFGLTIEMTMRDFVLPVASLVIDGDTIKPKVGDRITEGLETFEISPPDENKLAVELLTGGYEYLVHTNRIE